MLSTLSGLPIKQSIAVTGSLNQKGDVQPIGGVNEKIEGFYDVCKSRGITGDQGVIIPVQNIQELMLREDVIDAVAKGQFHIYAISRVEDGIELLTGAKPFLGDNINKLKRQILKQKPIPLHKRLANADRKLNRRNCLSWE